MQPTHVDQPQSKLLRFVFDDKVVSFDLDTDATLQDVARAFGKFPKQYRRKVVAIDVTIPTAVNASTSA